MNDITDQEKEFITLYRQFDGRRKYEVRQFMKELLEKDLRKPDKTDFQCLDGGKAD